MHAGSSTPLTSLADTPAVPFRHQLCASMIVKNEAHVIARCIASLRPVICAWAIVNTGSSDGTQELIRELLADLPGELIERPWVDFATNRNQALELAAKYGEYALTHDADECQGTRAGPAQRAGQRALRVLSGAKSA